MVVETFYSAAHKLAARVAILELGLYHYKSLPISAFLFLDHGTNSRCLPNVEKQL